MCCMAQGLEEFLKNSPKTKSQGKDCGSVGPAYCVTCSLPRGLDSHSVSPVRVPALSRKTTNVQMFIIFLREQKWSLQEENNLKTTQVKWVLRESLSGDRASGQGADAEPSSEIPERCAGPPPLPPTGRGRACISPSQTGSRTVHWAGKPSAEALRGGVLASGFFSGLESTQGRREPGSPSLYL